MALRNILRDDDAGLFKVSREVSDFNRRLHVLLDDMRETLISADGLGLAAPQVGVLRRVALIVDTDYDSEDVGEKIIELINPEFIYKEGENSASEGCLSVPGVYGMVTRPQAVKIKAFDRHGEAFELEAFDLTARAICHEIDHLNGIVFTSIAERILTDEELEEMRKEREREEAEVGS
ncbi:MAG: peptide deformylase [Oscillospiraceae bacterium]|nr:peptide deformylase [Oscillospiraceae bacterium]